MPQRTFVDSQHKKWTVWETAAPAAKPGEAHPLKVSAAFVHGWLTFDCEDVERRRLAPVPRHWEGLSDEELEHLCGAASPVRLFLR